MGIRTELTLTGASRSREYQRLNMQARHYPAHLLPRGGRGLCLFAAGFLGWNDVIHFARSRMTVDCVDVDADRLWEMATMYPEGFAFHVEDAWDFAKRAQYEGRTWDAVSVDPFFEDCAVKAWESLGLWLSLARRMVTLTVHADTDLNVPEGWSSYYFPRGEDVGWLVMQRA